MLNVTEYEKWVKDPVTREVFSQLEARARPQVLAENLTNDEATYRLGYVTGFWDAIDQARILVSVPQEEIPATYEGESTDANV